MPLEFHSFGKWLAMIALTAAFAVPASADSTVYSNGPINGQVNANDITDDQIANSFTLSGTTTLTKVDFGAWNVLGDTTTSVGWAIVASNPFPTSTSPPISLATAAVTNTFQFSNSQGADVYLDSFTLSGGLTLTAGTYYLVLGDAVASTSGDVVAWDINGGPSSVFQSEFGPLTIADCVPESTLTSCSDSFTILGTPTSAVPEPSILVFLGSGLICLVGLRRRMTN
jgi:PEP-CTERM motif